MPLSTQSTSPANRTGIVTKDESIKSATEKDRVIESLRGKCQEFSRLIISCQDVRVPVTDVSTYD